MVSNHLLSFPKMSPHTSCHFKGPISFTNVAFDCCPYHQSDLDLDGMAAAEVLSVPHVSVQFINNIHFQTWFVKLNKFKQFWLQHISGEGLFFMQQPSDFQIRMRNLPSSRPLLANLDTSFLMNSRLKLFLLLDNGVYFLL
jgi:hypothetical protein